MTPEQQPGRHERDYIERTIATVRNHREADNCWPQWANIFADEIEALWSERDRLVAERDEARQQAATARQQSSLDMGSAVGWEHRAEAAEGREAALRDALTDIKRWGVKADAKAAHSRRVVERAEAALAAVPAADPTPPGKCPNGLDEHGEWPCDPVPDGKGHATCSVCGFVGMFSSAGGAAGEAGDDEPWSGRRSVDDWIDCPRCERQRFDVGSCALCGNLGVLDENGDPFHCDCRADDWVEGDNGAIRCQQCGGYAGEPGTSIRLVGVEP